MISLRRSFPPHFAALQPHRVARFGGVCDTARLCPSTSTHGVARGRNVSIGNARVVISALDPSGAHPVAHDGNERTSYSRVGCVTAARGPWVPIRALRARAGLCLCVHVLTCACCVCMCVRWCAQATATGTSRTGTTWISPTLRIGRSTGCGCDALRTAISHRHAGSLQWGSLLLAWRAHTATISTM